MGADLYIGPLYQRQRQEWEGEFEKASRVRDRLPKDSEEYKAAQARVEECYDKMYERGYFRDSYNTNSLFWQFNLSWWVDVFPMLDKENQLSVEQASCLLEMLKD